MRLDGGVLLGVLFALVFVSAVLQSLSGFGFALLSVPVLTATIGGAETVSTVTGTVCDVAIRALRRSVRRPVGREVGALAGWSMPGMLVGPSLCWQFVGARAFRWFGSSRYERVVLCLLVASALGSVGTVVVGRGPVALLGVAGAGTSNDPRDSRRPA